jgi:hypothetical protein
MIFRRDAVSYGRLSPMIFSLSFVFSFFFSFSFASLVYLFFLLLLLLLLSFEDCLFAKDVRVLLFGNERRCRGKS